MKREEILDFRSADRGEEGKKSSIFWAYEGWGAYEGSGGNAAGAHKMHKFKKRAPPRALFELVHFVWNPPPPPRPFLSAVRHKNESCYGVGRAYPGPTGRVVIPPVGLVT